MRATCRSGFTLLEVLLAIMLTAVAVAIAGSALRTATTARERVAEHRDTLEREARLRAALTDMLRHAPSAESVDEPLLRVSRSPRGDAQLVFLSNGVRAPYGIGPIWRVTLTVSDSGLALDALPIGTAREASVLHTVVPGIRLLSVQLLERGGGMNRAQWRDDWPLERARPAMIALGFGDAQTRPPLVIALDPLATLAVRP